MNPSVDTLVNLTRNVNETNCVNLTRNSTDNSTVVMREEVVCDNTTTSTDESGDPSPVATQTTPTTDSKSVKFVSYWSNRVILPSLPPLFIPLLSSLSLPSLLSLSLPSLLS